MMKIHLTLGLEGTYARATHLGMGMHQKVHTIYRCHFTHLTYLTFTTHPSHPTPPDGGALHSLQVEGILGELVSGRWE